jgi:hypothetical protein
VGDVIRIDQYHKVVDATMFWVNAMRRRSEVRASTAGEKFPRKSARLSDPMADGDHIIDMEVPLDAAC